MPETHARLAALIENAADGIAPYWPLYGFIAVNPLRGLEHRPFEQAVREGAARFGGRGYPSRSQVGEALARGAIDPEVLTEVARRHGRSPASVQPGRTDPTPSRTPPARPGRSSPVDRLLIQWLTAFLDEGRAGWPMPRRRLGFFRAWRRCARHDPRIPDRQAIATLPDDALEALQRLLDDTPEREREERLRAHLAVLPGWSGYIKWRATALDHPRREAAPISLADYLAVRLALARQFAAEPEPPAAIEHEPEAPIWLEAWEETYRRRLIRDLRRAATLAPPAPTPLAQLVFCIDVRSEVLRRHLERSGPYETFGFAGFFGAAVRVRAFGAAHDHPSCPVLIAPRARVPEVPAPGTETRAERHLRGLARLRDLGRVLSGLKHSPVGAFAFAEASGPAYALAMLGRTLAPLGFRDLLARGRRWLTPEVATRPRIDLRVESEPDTPVGLSPAEQTRAAEGLLRVMGLTTRFAPLVVLCGHGGQTVNNPFAAGLDCGACAGHRGGPNARIMAAILNRPAIRARLAVRGIVIPDTTRFLAAEHDTTTDALTLSDDADSSPHQRPILARLRTDLDRARAGAVAERCRRLPDTDGAGLAAVERRAADWAQPRPEWALARNAAFIVGQRSLSRATDLEGRCFLHSYDWRADPDGAALTAIMTGPLVVAQWINSQYYFSTVDNVVYGAGSKVTHNVVGGFGVMQGNASDLMTGLPAQSVRVSAAQGHHEPLRLLTLIQAPTERVDSVIARNANLRQLFDNGWVALYVIDPTTERWQRRLPGGGWQADDAEPRRTAQPVREAVSA